MKKKLTKGNTSNYEIQFTVSEDERVLAKKKMLKRFGKDIKIPGFRQGHIPEEMVMQHVNPQHLTVGIFEEIINNWLTEILDEQKDIRFIGEPYDINNEEKKDELIITIKLDIYPEVEILNDKRSTQKMKKLNPKVKKEDVDAAITNLKKNYAEYVDSETITEDTVSKITMEYLDKDGEIKDKGTTYVGEPEFKEFDFFKKTFLKKKKESFELTYKEKDLPPTVQYSKKDKKDVKKVRFTITDIKQIVLPEMNEETLTKLFGKDTKVKNEKDLVTYVETTLKQNKEEEELIKQVEDLLNKIKGTCLKVEIPQTIIEQEQKSRVQNLEKRFGSQEKVEEYFKQLGEEKTKAFLDDIKKAASESLEKFFILQKLCELLEIQINREQNNNLEAERKLYEKLSGATPAKKEEKEEKKAPKKTTKK